jgi:hypothetical protein
MTRERAALLSGRVEAQTARAQDAIWMFLREHSAALLTGQFGFGSAAMDL